MDLPGHGEAVPGVERCGSLVAGPGSAVEDPDAVLAVFHSVSEDVYDSTVPCPPPEAVQELAAGVIVLVQVEGLGCLRLGVPQEGGELGQVHAGPCVVIVVVAGEPPGLLEEAAIRVSSPFSLVSVGILQPLHRWLCNKLRCGSAVV